MSTDVETVAPRRGVPIELIVEITLNGPLLTGASEAGPWGCDIVCARDAIGRLYLPGALVKGKVREVFEAMGTDPFDESRKRSGDIQARKAPGEQTENVDNPGDAGAASDPVTGTPLPRYPAIFSDFVSGDHWPEAGQQTITRTAIDSHTGAALDGALRVIDCPVLPGEEATFRGYVRCIVGGTEAISYDAKGHGFRELEIDSDSLSTIGSQLEKALQWIPSFGAEQSVGMGRTIDARIVGHRNLYDDQYGKGFPVHSTASEAKRPIPFAVVDWEVADPFCVASGVVNGNIFESDDHLRGDVLKGAVAESLRRIHGLAQETDLSSVKQGDFSKLCQYLSDIRFTTARPCRTAKTGLPRVRPHSLAVAGNHVFDMALADRLIDPDFAPVIDGQAVRFLHDWKSEDQDLVRETFPIAPLMREFRVRTTIDSENRRARDNRLFAYRLIRPEGFVWRGTIGISSRAGLDASDADALWRQLGTFLAMGFLHVGKTKARVRGIVRESIDAGNEISQALDPNFWPSDAPIVLTLQSAAMLLDPAKLLTQENKPVSRNQINKLYEDIWNELSGGRLKPMYRFATHRLIGGFQAYRFRRFVKQNTRQDQQPYNPALLTEPGSVFVFEPVGNAPDQKDAVRIMLARWYRDGLPCPDVEWVNSGYGRTFKTNPYLPTNGYGEIAVNLACHQELNPKSNMAALP